MKWAVLCAFQAAAPPVAVDRVGEDRLGRAQRARRGAGAGAQAGAGGASPRTAHAAWPRGGGGLDAQPTTPSRSDETQTGASRHACMLATLRFQRHQGRVKDGVAAAAQRRARLDDAPVGLDAAPLQQRRPSAS